MEFGDVLEISAKLKDPVRSININATGNSAKLEELYHTFQMIATKIKASGSQSLLENNEEYIALVAKHLPKDMPRDGASRKSLGGLILQLFRMESSYSQ